MIKSDNGKKIIESIPKNKLLTESDGPFIEENGQPLKPVDIIIVHKYLSSLWSLTMNEVDIQIKRNFEHLISAIKY